MLRINVKELKAKIIFLEDQSANAEAVSRQEAAARAIQKFYRSKTFIPRRLSTVSNTVYEEDPNLRTQLKEATAQTGIILLNHTFNSLDSMLTAVSKKFVFRSKDLKKD